MAFRCCAALLKLLRKVSGSIARWVEQDSSVGGTGTWGGEKGHGWRGEAAKEIEGDRQRIRPAHVVGQYFEIMEEECVTKY